MGGVYSALSVDLPTSLINASRLYGSIFSASDRPDTMEAISFAASLITLIETITVITKATTTLCRNIHDAPNELAALGVRLLMLQVELEALRYLTTAELDRILPSTLRLSLLSALQLGYETLKEILKVCEKSCGIPGVRGRLKWSLLNHSLVAKHLERLRSVEESLAFLLQVVIT